MTEEIEVDDLLRAYDDTTNTPLERLLATAYEAVLAERNSAREAHQYASRLCVEQREETYAARKEAKSALAEERGRGRRRKRPARRCGKHGREWSRVFPDFTVRILLVLSVLHTPKLMPLEIFGMPQLR